MKLTSFFSTKLLKSFLLAKYLLFVAATLKSGIDTTVIVSLFYSHSSFKNVIEKSNREKLKVIKNSLLNRLGNPEGLKK